LTSLTRLQHYRPARYLVIGAVCALAHNLVMIVGDWLGAHYLALMLVSFGLVTPMAYWLHTAFTFDAPRTLRSFSRFAAGVATGFPLSLLLTALLFSGLGAPMIIAAPVTTVLLVFWNYCSARWAIVKGTRLKAPLGVAGRP
jgi:putative flippase GtrA